MEGRCWSLVVEQALGRLPRTSSERGEIRRRVREIKKRRRGRGSELMKIVKGNQEFEKLKELSRWL